MEENIVLLTSEKINEVVEEFTNMRGKNPKEFDSESIDNAIRLCERMDICFERFSSREKVLLQQNFDFFSSASKFSMFLKVLFRGGIQSKEITFKALFHKLKATRQVVDTLVANKSMYSSTEEWEQVNHRLNNFFYTMLYSFSKLLPPSRQLSEVTLQAMQGVLREPKPLFIKQEVPYFTLVTDFSDLIYDIFHHECLPLYLHWKDEYFCYWLIHVLRAEDRMRITPAPELNTIKADVYAEFQSWTKISKRLNANLRHRQTFENQTTISAEETLLLRLPSDVLAKVVLAIRRKMEEANKAEVPIGIDDEHLVEEDITNSMITEMVEEEDKHGDGKEGWLGKMKSSLFKLFKPMPKSQEVDPNKVPRIARIAPERFFPQCQLNRMTFGSNFPKDYGQDVSKDLALFFTRSRKNYLNHFDQAVQEVLWAYESQQGAVIIETPRQMVFKGSGQPIEFSERSLALLVDPKNILMLGSTYFEMSLVEYSENPSTRGYFVWLVKSDERQYKRGLLGIGNNTFYKPIPMSEVGQYQADIKVGLLKVLDGMPDLNREKPPVQFMLDFLKKTLQHEQIQQIKPPAS